MPRVIIVGVAQKTARPATPEEFVPPIEAMRGVARLAAEDARDSRLAGQIDAIHVVNILSWQPADAPTALADALGAKPSIKEYTAVGGNSPQWLVNRVADNIARGKTRLALLAGCEVMHSLRLSAKMGRDIGAYREGVQIPLVGVQKNGTLDEEIAHGADLPVRIYPLFENALRFKDGMSLAEQRRCLGEFGERCNQVAMKNPHAWHRKSLSAEEIVEPGPTNRMISFPYTRALNSELYVDQAAAVLVTTPEYAKEAGIPESQWVYLHGGQDAHDEWFVSHRRDIADLPAVRACVEDSLRQAELGLRDITVFDLYSCFPCVPRMTQRVLGIPYSDSRPVTLTGGLPFFGGPGNNYVMHSIAEAVMHCRKRSTEYALVTGNGYYATKHSVGIYGAKAPNREWSRTPTEAFQESMALPEPVEVDTNPSGEFRVESYTVWHDRSGEPEYSILCGLTESGKRAWAQSPRDDVDLLRAMTKEEWIGKVGTIRRSEGPIHIVAFD